ncbi:hypothetical protein [Levilactobacillus wangkuiensis]|uniref:hypothetical protein n=1 Tax=Levilactobacillus wangkuiensis TaxID=2799566 RepID=UPI0019452182|nr:hypothetical protein [Levilactobacillus wangkuiensis]
MTKNWQRGLLVVGLMVAGLSVGQPTTANAATKLAVVPKALRGTWVTHYRESKSYGVEIFTATTWRERIGRTKTQALHAKNKSRYQLRQTKPINQRTFTLTGTRGHWQAHYRLNDMAFPNQSIWLKQRRLKGKTQLVLTAFNPARTDVFTKVTKK